MATRPAPMLDDYAALIARGVVSVATVGDDLVGLIVMWPEADHFFIDNIAIAPDAQGSGIGGLLLNRADDQARRHGRTEIRLYTNEVMTENLDYYPRRSFVESHRSVDSGYSRVYFTRRLSATR